MSKLHLQLLSDFRLRVFGIKGATGGDIPIPGKKNQALLSFLALNPGPHTREKLATLLWGDRMDGQARHSLRQAISALRKVLAQNGDVFDTEGDTLSLAEGAIEVDALAFSRMANSDDAKSLEMAAALYSGPLLDGVHTEAEEFDHWLASERERLHSLACIALEKLALHHERVRHTEKAIDTARRLLNLDQAREEAHRLLMRLYAAMGRRADALRQYQAGAEALRSELDAGPSAETVRLYEEIRGGKSATSDRAGAADFSIVTALSDRPPPLPDRPSIAVLPFENMGGKPEQEFFGDGLAEDILTDLSKLSGLFVIGSHSTFTYKGKSVASSVIGQELGIRHILGGSVRISGSQVRVTTKLVEAESGHQIWAERYDRPLEDLFAVQDEITEEVVTALNIKLVDGEQARIWRNSLKKLEARELFYNARNNFNKLTKESQVHTRKLFAQVIEIEPESPLGYVRMAWSHWYDLFRGWSDSSEHSLTRAEEFAQKAFLLDEQDPEARITRGLIHLVKREFEEAMVEGERAVILGPNMADVVAFHGMISYFVGHNEEALVSLNRAIRLCPICPAYYWVLLGQTCNILGNHEDAVKSFKKSAAIEPDYPTSYFGQTIAFGALGKKKDAHGAAEAFRRVAPLSVSLRDYALKHPFKDNSVIEMWIKVLEKTGIE